MTALRRAVEQHQVLLTVGAGGVGKTTVAAALALRSAMEGTASMVCTIDPAKRLANALGLSRLGNNETRVEPDTFAKAGLATRAPLHAMMLDMKRTWDELIERRAPPDKRERILSNRFYQALSTALAGSQEYIAMEKLCELKSRRPHELIVLDTPPTTHALDFLDAPNRILDFLDNDAAKWLLTPALAAGRVGLKLFNLGGSAVTKTLARFTGTQTLQQLAEFMLALSSMNEGFRERAQQTRSLLQSPSTGFVLVTAATNERLDEAITFHGLLKASGMRVVAMVVNRVNPPVSQARADLAAAPARLQRQLQQTIEEAEAMAAGDRAGIARLKEACPETPLVPVPRIEGDVHDVGSLYHTSRWLWGDERLAG
jgi:anion-transporting  ArsA/GET3 family ATPase